MKQQQAMPSQHFILNIFYSEIQDLINNKNRVTVVSGIAVGEHVPDQLLPWWVLGFEDIQRVFWWG